MSQVILSPIGNGADDSQMIQDAIDCMEARGGGVVHLTSGKYYLGATNGTAPPATGEYSIKLADNVHLSLDVDVTVVRRFSSINTLDATIRNKDFDGNSNIRLTGGTLTIESDTNVGFQIVFTKTSFLSIDNVTLRGVSTDWNVLLTDCTDVTVSNLVMDSGTEGTEDGLHISGGARIAVTNCVISCGDDAIALVHSVSNETTDLTDVVISNCYLWSRTANAIKVEVDQGVEHSISRVRISNIVAKTGDGVSSTAVGIVINDLTDAEERLVSDIEIDGVLLDAGQNSSKGLIIAKVDKVRLHNVVIRHPYQFCTIDDSDDVELWNCVIDSPRLTGNHCLLVAENFACNNISIIGGEYRNATFHGIQLGATGTVTGFQISNAFVEGANNSGILIENAFNGLVSGNRITGCNLGIQEDSPSDFNLYIANHVRGNVGAIQLYTPAHGSKDNVFNLT